LGYQLFMAWVYRETEEENVEEVLVPSHFL
jgi:hypothetical protein